MYNSESFILSEPTIQYGTVTGVDTLTPATDPSTLFTPIGDLGYKRMGTIKINIVDTFVEYLTKTPHEIIRKDMLQRTYTWDFTANQNDLENYKVLYNLFAEEAAFRLAWIGPNTPVRPRYAWLATGKKVDGTLTYAYIWSGAVVTGDMSRAYSGNDYLNIPAQIQSFPAPEFTAIGPDAGDTKKYGLIWEPVLSS